MNALWLLVYAVMLPSGDINVGALDGYEFPSLFECREFALGNFVPAVVGNGGKIVQLMCVGVQEEGDAEHGDLDVPMF